MRASSLSNARVIELVSRYFVPIWLSRDNYQKGTRSKAEWEEIRRIDRDKQQRGLKGGTVCVYMLAPDGAVLATLPVHHAHDPKNLVPFLKQIIDKEKLEPRNPEAVRASAAPRPKVQPHEEGGLVLHVRTKNEGARAGYGVSEDWAELTPQEWKAFLPSGSGEIRVGDSRKVDDKVADKLFLYFYPPGPNWKSKDGTVLERALTATVVSVTARDVRIGLRGSVVLSHPFGDKDTPGKVTARLAGVLHYDPTTKTINSFVMASEEANFVWEWKGRPQPEKMVIAVETEQ
jgi:hypothetical protein